MYLSEKISELKISGVNQEFSKERPKIDSIVAKICTLPMGRVAVLLLPLFAAAKVATVPAVRAPYPAIDKCASAKNPGMKFPVTLAILFVKTAAGYRSGFCFLTLTKPIVTKIIVIILKLRLIPRSPLPSPTLPGLCQQRPPTPRIWILQSTPIRIARLP